MTTPHHHHRIRVLVVDDSALVRKILTTGFAKDPGIEVVGQAGDPFQARDMMVELKPDVITLDVEMPHMDGVTFLKRFMPVKPTPTVMISSLTQKGKRITLEALEAGAVDVIAKPAVGVVDELPAMLTDICRRVKAAAMVDVSRYARHSAAPPLEAVTALEETTDRIIALGASTGGVQALGRIMPAFPPDGPGIVIVQHMPAGFTASFAERLASLSRMRVKEAGEGDRIMPGLALLAPGGKRHMSVVRSGGEYRIHLAEGEEVNYSRPAVDVLFNSVAREAGRNVSAGLLTGMGKDGAAGLLAIRKAGGRTVAQDEASCVVYGMPGAAREMGAAEHMAPLDKIPALLVGALNRH
jgi:two-component system chemotaxis response regulator CheB